MAIIALFSIWGALIYKINDNYICDILLIIAGIIPTIVFVVWFFSSQKYAKENPELALMEGAQLVMARQFQYQTANPQRSINSGEERSDGRVISSPMSDERDKDV